MRNLEAFVQGQDIVYKNLVILISLFLILAFGLYISYILYEKKNYPIYLSENVFNDYLEKSNLNVPTNKSVIDNVDVATIKNIENISTISHCPRGQCIVNLTTGVKVCPIINDSNSSTNNVTGLAYDPGLEVCVESNKCPPSLPYAIKSDGEALDSLCSFGESCYCTATPQCATRVVKYFQNTVTGVPQSLSRSDQNFSFSTSGNKEDGNILNNLKLDVKKSENIDFCKLNPAFTDRIVDGCNFKNKWNDPSGCEITNILATTEITKFKLANYMDVLASFNNMPRPPSSIAELERYPKGSNFIGVIQDTSNPSLSNRDLISFFGQGGSFNFEGDNTKYYYENVIVNQKLILLENIHYVEDQNNLAYNVFGLKNFSTQGIGVDISNFLIDNCQNSTNDTVNFKNMLNCVQNYNQPCTEGVLAYNVDILNPRNFCQGTGVSLTLGQNTPINDFFLTNPAYYTTSCVIGSGCDNTIDTSLCESATDCTNAFIEKIDKLFPKKDLSALTNNFIAQPSSLGLSFIPTISNTETLYTITNNFIPLELGDYWVHENNSQNKVILISDAINGSNILNVNNSIDLTIGMSINLNNEYKISNIIGTSVFLNSNLTTLDTTIARTGFLLKTYSSTNDYGIVTNISNFYNGQNFNLYSLLSNNNISSIDANEKSISFYKQFGFNGLNYNTIYDPVNDKRIFNSDYLYKKLNPTTDLSPPFTIYELLGSQKISGLLNKDANFRKNYSMYYPVFNQNNFRQECVYCSPSLHTDSLVNRSGSLEGLNIQFSGQDFFHYGYGILDNNDPRYSYISFAITAVDKNRLNSLSNTSNIVLSAPLLNLKVGDYVIDEDGYFFKDMVDLDNNSFNTPIKASNIVSKYTIDDKYLPYRLNNKIFLANDGNKFSISPDINSGIKNVFYGKAYYAFNSDETLDYSKAYYVKPLVRVTRISSDGKTITTDSQDIIPIKGKKVIQFICAEEFLEVDVVQDPEDVLKAVGSGARVSINSITQGRITSLKIDSGGNGYNKLNKPLIYISKYSPSNSLFDISN